MISQLHSKLGIVYASNRKIICLCKITVSDVITEAKCCIAVVKVKKQNDVYRMSLKDDDVRLKWDDGSLLAITLTRSLFAGKNAGGMCGNYDGNAKNDVPPPNDVTRLGNLYRLDGVRKTSLFLLTL